MRCNGGNCGISGRKILIQEIGDTRRKLRKKLLSDNIAAKNILQSSNGQSAIPYLLFF